MEPSEGNASRSNLVPGVRQRAHGSGARAAVASQGAEAQQVDRAQHERRTGPREQCPRQGEPELPDRRNAEHGRERSEEHTSELQSPCNLVCRLLLEKKKKKQ